MKKTFFVLIVLSALVLSCNNEAKDTVEKADSTNEVKQDSAAAGSPQAIVTDEESTAFLVKAANNGMAEVQLGELAQQKAVNQRVKDFGGMLKTDHTAANDLVATLAMRRNVTLPAAVGEVQKKDIEDLNKKSGADFDRAYIKSMKEHTTKPLIFLNRQLIK